MSLEIKRRIAELRAHNLCYDSQLDEIKEVEESVNNYSRLLSNNSQFKQLQHGQQTPSGAVPLVSALLNKRSESI